jgi:hypothetical protein
MAKQRAPKKVISEEERLKQALTSELRDIRERLVFGILPKNPTRQFVVGERVQWGALEETYVREVCEGGLYYIIESIGVQRDRYNPPANETRYAEWHEVFKYNQDKATTFRKEEEHRVRFLNSGIDSLLNMVYYFGVDFDVDYQREHVWSLDDKIALIDSIFNNVDIGKFVFVQRTMKHEGKLYEIIDGKQRLTAICEFIEGRFPYKGVYFAEMSNSDKNKIRNHGISWGYLENPNRRAIFETFIKLNTSGRPMENKDIDKVKKLLNELG